MLVIGMFAIFGWEFSLPVLAAVLAVLGYSVNESVIIFDRVREHFKKFRKMTTVEVIDSAITATISRTIITHGCTLAMTLAMYFFGGPALHYFALALTIGIMLRRVLVGVRRRRDRDVPGREARGPRQAGQEGRPEQQIVALGNHAMRRPAASHGDADDSVSGATEAAPRRPYLGPADAAVSLGAGGPRDFFLRSAAKFGDATGSSGISARATSSSR